MLKTKKGTKKWGNVQLVKLEYWRKNRSGLDHLTPQEHPEYKTIEACILDYMNSFFVGEKLLDKEFSVSTRINPKTKIADEDPEELEQLAVEYLDLPSSKLVQENKDLVFHLYYADKSLFKISYDLSQKEWKLSKITPKIPEDDWT